MLQPVSAPLVAARDPQQQLKRQYPPQRIRRSPSAATSFWIDRQRQRTPPLLLDQGKRHEIGASATAMPTPSSTRDNAGHLFMKGSRGSLWSSINLRFLQPRRSRLSRCRLRPPASSPADDYVEVGIDLNEQLIRHPTSTFFLRVSGESMTGAGIHDGDLLVVDRSLDPRPGRVVVAVLTVPSRSSDCAIAAACDSRQPIRTIPELHRCGDVQIWGVAVHPSVPTPPCPGPPP